MQLDAGKGDRVMGPTPGLVTEPSQIEEAPWCCKYKWLVGWMEWVDNSIELRTVLNKLSLNLGLGRPVGCCQLLLNEDYCGLLLTGTGSKRHFGD